MTIYQISFLGLFQTGKQLRFDSKFADRVQEVLPLLLLGLQTLLMLVESATDSSGLPGPQVQGLVLLTLKDKYSGLLPVL